MNRYAIIEAGVVANVARAAEPLGANWVELDPGSAVGPGWLYDGEDFSAPAGPDIEAVRAALMASVRDERDRRIEGGFEWDGSPFDSDAAISQPRLLGLFTTALAGGLPPEGYAWRLANNSWRVLSAADAAAVWGAFQTHMAAHFAAFAAHESAILAETDLEALRAYNLAAGWPT